MATVIPISRYQPRQVKPWLGSPWGLIDTPSFSAGRAVEQTVGFADAGAKVLRLGFMWGGRAHYQGSLAAPPHPYLYVSNPIPDVIAMARQRKMKVLVYINPAAWYDVNPAYETAPLINEDGEPWDRKAYGITDTRWACVHHPDFRDFYTAVIAEICEYDIDGFYFDGLRARNCHCAYCQAQYLADTGEAKPLVGNEFDPSPEIHGWFEMRSIADLQFYGDPGNATHLAYSLWLGHREDEITKWFFDLIRGHDPALAVTYHEWPKVSRKQYYEATLIEMWDGRPWWNTLWSNAQIANWSNSFGVPTTSNIKASQRWWNGVSRAITEEVELRHNYWQMLANGTYPNAYFANRRAEPWVFYHAHTDVYDFASTYPAPFLAMVQSDRHGARDNWLRDRITRPDVKVDPPCSPSWGMFAALLHAGLPTKIIHPNHITTKTLQRFKVLVLPGITCMSDEQCAEVDAWVRSGGGLIVTGLTSMYDMQAELRVTFGLADAIGLDTPPEGEGLPESYTREHGKGRVVYIPGWRDALYAKPQADHSDPDFVTLITSLVSYAAQGNIPFAVTSHVPKVGVTVFEQPTRSRTLVHLINYDAPWTNESFATLPRQNNVRLTVRKQGDRELKEAVALRGATLTTTNARTTWTITVNRLDEYEIIILNWKDDTIMNVKTVRTGSTLAVAQAAVDAVVGAAEAGAVIIVGEQSWDGSLLLTDANNVYLLGVAAVITQADSAAPSILVQDSTGSVVSDFRCIGGKHAVQVVGGSGAVRWCDLIDGTGTAVEIDSGVLEDWNIVT